jgi:hypothetical protein
LAGMFFFFSNRLGCFGSVLISAVVTVALLFMLGCCVSKLGCRRNLETADDPFAPLNGGPSIHIPSIQMIHGW